MIEPDEKRYEVADQMSNCFCFSSKVWEKMLPTSEDTDYILVNGRRGLYLLMKVIQNIVQHFRLKFLGLALNLEVFTLLLC